jgi:branched-chain amino acid transport system substrate-binding protein
VTKVVKFRCIKYILQGGKMLRTAKKEGIAVFVLLVFMVLSPVISHSAEWRIGVLLPLSGPTAVWGSYALRSIEIAQEMINERGGINGNKIVFVKADAPNPTAAASECNRLIAQENVKLIMGSGTSGNAMAATGVAEKAKVFYYETGAVADDITGRGFKYTFRHLVKSTMIADSQLEFISKSIAKWLKKDPKDLKVVLVHEDGPYGTSITGVIKANAKKHGLEVKAVESYNAKTADLSPLILRLKSMDPDVIAIVSYLQDAILFTKQMKQYNFVPKTFYGMATGYEVKEFIQDRGDDADGFFISWSPPYVDPSVLTAEGKKLREEFISRYKKKYNEEPTGIAGFNFSSAWCLFAHILPNAGALDPDKIRKAALEVDKPYGTYPNAYGTKFDATGQNTRAFSAASQYQNKKLVDLYPDMVNAGQHIMVPLPPWDKRK